MYFVSLLSLFVVSRCLVVQEQQLIDWDGDGKASILSTLKRHYILSVLTLQIWKRLMKLPHIDAPIGPAGGRTTRASSMFLPGRRNIVPRGRLSANTVKAMSVDFLCASV